MTTIENGAREIALPSVTELELSSGITVWIRPASLNDQRLIREKVYEVHPLPREADYKIPVPEDMATIPGQTMTDTEAYKEALSTAARKQQDLWLRMHILMCVDFPEGTEAIVERYLPEIRRKRLVLDLPKDDLEAVIFHAIVRTQDDELLIAQAITLRLPVEMSEVISQLRIFRPENQRRNNHPVHQRRKKTLVSGVDTGEDSAGGDESPV